MLCAWGYFQGCSGTQLFGSCLFIGTLIACDDARPESEGYHPIRDASLYIACMQAWKSGSLVHLWRLTVRKGVDLDDDEGKYCLPFFPDSKLKTLMLAHRHGSTSRFLRLAPPRHFHQGYNIFKAYPVGKWEFNFLRKPFPITTSCIRMFLTFIMTLNIALWRNGRRDRRMCR